MKIPIELVCVYYISRKKTLGYTHRITLDY